MQAVKIIAFVGMPGSGKGTCTNFLEGKYGWPIVHFGNMVYDEVQRRGLDNVQDEIFVREDMRKVEGPAVLAKHAARKAQDYGTEGKQVVVFDGLYSWSEYKYLEETFSSQLTVIAVTAPKALRRERVIMRQDAHRKYTLEQLVEREIAEIENLEKGGPIAFADYTIANDGRPEDMLSKLTTILQEAGIVAN